MQQIFSTARQWMQLDPINAEVLEQEIAAAEAGDDVATTNLTKRFTGYLTFGTAGLRAPLGPGTMHMNSVVVQRAAAGIADFARERVAVPTVVIGYDARHGSQTFAQDSAAVFTAAGCQVFLVSAPVPTPVLAFALRHLDADVGIMVTASHNPPTDNGYKVYLGARLVQSQDTAGAFAQITSPVDRVIADHIHRWNTATTLPARHDSGWQLLGTTIIEDYVASVANFLAEQSDTPRDIRARLNTVYTPLHGVGAATLHRLFEHTGFSAPVDVVQQLEPDPTFATVAFPNPEEPGALDLAIATAKATPDTDLIVAHDPDADRLAVVVPFEGTWQRLTGDQVGLLLGARLMPYLHSRGLAVGNSVVSARQLAQLAEQHGINHVVTPTGFKWICRVPELGYGYEEALGYAVAPHLVNDKDGLSAAVIMADLAAELKASGSDLMSYLAGLTDVLGPAVAEQISVGVSSPAVTEQLVNALRTTGPKTLAGRGPVTMVDYQHDEVELTQRYGSMPMLEFSTMGPLAARMMIRPSGTEPKVKCYLSVAASPGTPLAEVETALQQLRDDAVRLLNVPEGEKLGPFRTT